MSHVVSPADLASTATPYGGTPFLLYAGDDGSARVNHVVATIESADSSGDSTTVVRCTGFGRGVARPVDAGARLSLLWPATAPDMFSLIADGVGTIESDVLSIVVSGAVLHRPAPVDGADRC